MKISIVVMGAVVCAVAAVVSCNVGISVGQDGGGQDETARDSGGRPEGDGGGSDRGGGSDAGGELDTGTGDDGGSCPPGSHEPTCHSDTDCADGFVCIALFEGREECGTECRSSADCPDYGAPVGEYCLRDADCPADHVCEYFDPARPECGGGCEFVDILTDGGVPDAGRPDGAETCVTTCDCAFGLFCEAGVCVPPGGGVGQVSCCDRPCPSGMPCQHADGHYGTCPGDADVGWPDAGSCVGEGGSINKTGDPNPPRCCFGLDELPLMSADPTGGCAAPGCDCVVCTTPCGNGRCSAGKNVCNCEQDCAPQPPGGPGSKCASDKDCKGGATCLTEKSGYPAGGYCAGPVCDVLGNPGQCPAGSICLPMDFAQAPGLCVDACGADHDCRDGLTCEAMPVSARYYGTPYFCWQPGTGGLGKGLGEACKDGTDCITRMCEPLGAGSVKVCTQYCYSQEPCKAEQICAPTLNCGAPDCGACFYPVK